MSAPRAWAISAMPAIGRTAPVAHRTCETATSLVRSSIAASKAASTASWSSAAPTSTYRDLDPESFAQVVERARATGMLEARRDRAIAGLPVDRPRADVHAVGGRVGQGDVRRIGHEHRGDRGPRFGHPLERVEPVVGVGAPRRELVRRDLVHRGGRLSGDRTHRTRVQVDPGLEGGEGRPDRGQAVRIGRERGDHGRMIPTMSGLARPELVATPEWVAENLGRQGVRILDARWRPDGTGVQVYRAGQIPGARYIDWRADLVDDAEDSDAIRLAAPDRIAEVASRVGHRRRYDGRHLRRHPGVVRGPRVVVAPGLRTPAGAHPRRRVPGLGGRESPHLARPVRRDRATRGPVRAARAEPHAPHDLGCPRDARRAERGPPRRASARRVPRLRGQYPAARPYPGRRERAGRQHA